MTLPQFEGGLLGGTLFEEEPLEGPLLVEASWGRRWEVMEVEEIKACGGWRNSWWRKSWWWWR